MTIRDARASEREILVSLWDEWVGNGELPPWAEGAREETIAGIDEALRAGAAVVAEEDGEVVGFACGLRRGTRGAEISELYVRPSARRRGLGAQLLRATVEGLQARGAEFVSVDVGIDNASARALYDRAGFEPELVRLVAPVARLGERLAAAPPAGRSFGSIHVQTDDEPAVERAVRQFVPRLPGGSRGSIVSPPRNGWIAVYDDVCDRDPKMLHRLARELSDRMGAVVLVLGVEVGAVVRFILFERGSIVDEYLSVQEFYGPLPPGDVVALAANPRVVARLTGADPAAVRAAALHAGSPEDLPATEELLAGLAAAIGVEGAGHGWEDAPDSPGFVRIERE